MKYRFLSCVLLVCSYACGQPQIDSLQRLLKQSILEKRPKEISYYYSLIGSHFLRSNAYDSALLYYLKSLPYTDNDHLSLRASTLNGIGVVHSYKGYTDSSIYYYKEALGIYHLLSDEENIINIETNLSIIYKNKGLFEEALESAFAAISKLEKKKPDKILASCYSTVGSVYGNINEYDLAIRFHRKALELRLLLDYKRGIGQSYNNIGEIFLKWSKYDSALHHLQLALKIKTANGEQAPATLNNMGEVFMKTNRFVQARQSFEQALAVYKRTGDQIGQITSFIQLGKLDMLNNDLKKAGYLFGQSETLARQSGSLYYLKQVLEEKVILYQKEKSFEKAFRTSAELSIVKDSLLNSEKSEALSTLQIKYETDKKEQQIRQLQSEKEIQKIQLQWNTRWLRSLIAVAILMIIIVSLIFLLYKSSQKSKMKVDLLLRELNHRVKNNLQILSSLLNLQSGYLKDPTAIEVIKSNEGRVNAMALIHKKLSIHDSSQRINMQEYLQELIQYLVHSYGYSVQNLALTIQVDDVKFNVDKAIPVGLIVNELVTNAFKYAFPTSSHPVLKVALSQSERESRLEISDNGIMSAIKEASPESFGLKMVDILIKELKAQVKRVTDKGTSFIITIPNR